MGPGTVPSGINIFNSNSSSDVCILIVPPFYTQDKWKRRTLNNMSKVTQLINGRGTLGILVTLH